MKSLVCNTTSYENTDYDKPITVHKSTDYRTSTGTNHRYIPPFPQDFDARYKIPGRKLKNPVHTEDVYKSETRRSYGPISVGGSYANSFRVACSDNVHYLRSEEEKAFKDPPPPIMGYTSVTQEDFAHRSAPLEPVAMPPKPLSCDVRGFGRDEQPPVRPEDKGFHKHLDIYLTTSRASYVPYSQKVLEGLARKDIVTYYDATDVPRGGKGYGPKNNTKIERLVPRRSSPERRKKESPGHKSSFTDVPPFRGKSEYDDQYKPQTYSSFYPFLFESGVEFNAALPSATSWQAAAAPGSYCTEYCHCGSGWPVRAVVELKKPKREYQHKLKNYFDCRS